MSPEAYHLELGDKLLVSPKVMYQSHRSFNTSDNLPATATDVEIITVSSTLEEKQPSEKSNSAQAATIKATKATLSVQADDDIPATTTDPEHSQKFRTTSGVT